MLDDAVTEALRSGTDRVLVQDSESQLWAFYADSGGKPPNGDLANVRGGGDDPQRKAGPLPKGGLGGTGRYPRGYRRRGECTLPLPLSPVGHCLSVTGPLSHGFLVSVRKFV